MIFVSDPAKSSPILCHTLTRKRRPSRWTPSPTTSGKRRRKTLSTTINTNISRNNKNNNSNNKREQNFTGKIRTMTASEISLLQQGPTRNLLRRKSWSFLTTTGRSPPTRPSTPEVATGLWRGPTTTSASPARPQNPTAWPRACLRPTERTTWPWRSPRFKRETVRSRKTNRWRRRSDEHRRRTRSRIPGARPRGSRKSGGRTVSSCSSNNSSSRTDTDPKLFPGPDPVRSRRSGWWVSRIIRSSISRWCEWPRKEWNANFWDGTKSDSKTKSIRNKNLIRKKARKLSQKKEKS